MADQIQVVIGELSLFTERIVKRIAHRADVRRHFTAA